MPSSERPVPLDERGGEGGRQLDGLGDVPVPDPAVAPKGASCGLRAQRHRRSRRGRHSRNGSVDQSNLGGLISAMISSIYTEVVDISRLT